MKSKIYANGIRGRGVHLRPPGWFPAPSVLKKCSNLGEPCDLIMSFSPAKTRASFSQVFGLFQAAASGLARSCGVEYKSQVLPTAAFTPIHHLHPELLSLWM